MSRYPWTADLLLSPAQAAAVVGSRFPELRPARASWLARGWGLAAFLVNEEWVFRFPVRADVGPGLVRERRLIETLRPRCALPIPEIRFVGEPGPDFPWPFCGQRLARGVPGHRLEIPASARPALAAEFGRFLTSLHGIPTALAPGMGLPPWSPRSRTDPADRVRQAVELARGFVDDDLRRRSEACARAAAVRHGVFRGEPRIGHHDLLPWHVHLDPCGFGVTGIIDWEDAGLGDPAGDFAGLAFWLGPGFVEETLGNYALPRDDIAERARLLAVEVALHEARYGVLGGDDECRAAALRALRLNLPE